MCFIERGNFLLLSGGMTNFAGKIEKQRARMIGTIVNTLTIVVGSVIGAVARRGISDRYKDGVFTALGLATVVLGANVSITHLAHSEYPVLFILSLAIGTLVGTALRLHERVTAFAEKRGGATLAHGLVTSVLLYCVGTLSIMGPVMSALQGDNTFLYTNATLDFVSAMIFAANYGIGIILGAVALFCWQGAIYLLALTLGGGAMPEALTHELCVVGGVLILSSGLSILALKDCKTINMLPSLLIPPIYFLIF